ncbi:hypothetical protein [Ferrimonas balearica]|uniref:hypothetical protein n=1 Tax=Ferrimonas balearica TaxID=44012 RepID=UPI001C9505C4|nr:hypothetical protein [Ferrimonas balearica]MBY5979190.1 hypothetical protein [Ferrimonas balearica]
MNRLHCAIGALAMVSALVFADVAGSQDGHVRIGADSQLEAWDAEAGQWLSPEQFWLAYAARNGGLTWGRGSDYPPYGEVKEGDTFMVELDSGPCLMEFFHKRWRRANDVRRWDTAFSDIGGCAKVFD